MSLLLTQLYDLPKLQGLLESFYAVTGISAAVIDAEGNLLASSFRPALCMQFYDRQVNGEKGCHQNRISLLRQDLATQEKPVSYCAHGLIDAASPIVIEGKTLGALLIGQVFDTAPDLAQYRAEAVTMGFDPELFLQAIAAVPVVDRKDFEQSVKLMSSLTTMLADQGMACYRAQINEQAVKDHADRTIKDVRRQKAQLALYSMEHTSQNDLLDTALEDMLAITDSSIGYIFLYDEDTCLFTVYAWSKSVMLECTIIHKQTVYQLEKIGLLGEAVRQRRPIITNDYAVANPLKHGQPEGHVPLVRHLSLPVFCNNKIVAVVGVGNKAVDYTDNDVRQLQLFMEGVWNIVERRKAVEELQIAKEFAESSNRMKTELLANLSHELRTPLNGVIGGSQLMRFTDLSEEQAEYLDIIDVASGNELDLVNNLLELVKLEAEGTVLEQSPFSIRQCIDEVIQAHLGVARVKNIELCQELPEDIPVEVVGDKVRIRQILHSLLGNALKFTEQGMVKIKLVCESDHKGRFRTCFSVIDTGIGIEADKLDAIFELFIQSDMSNTRSFGGLGLGLSICRRLVTLMGGRIWVESTPGKGSSFHFELFLNQNDSINRGMKPQRDMQILLVDDDHLSLLTSEALLCKLGHQVMTARNGKEAVSLCKRKIFDLLLMDIHMPTLNGFDALLQIRAIEKEQGRDRVPVVAQTAYACLNYHDSFLSADFDGFISKPLMREELEAVIASSVG